VPSGSQSAVLQCLVVALCSCSGVHHVASTSSEKKLAGTLSVVLFLSSAAAACSSGEHRSPTIPIAQNRARSRPVDEISIVRASCSTFACCQSSSVQNPNFVLQPVSSKQFNGIPVPWIRFRPNTLYWSVVIHRFFPKPSASSFLEETPTAFVST